MINPAVETAETPAAQSIAPPGQEAAPDVTDLFQSYRSSSELGAVQLNTASQQTAGQQTTGQHLGDPNATLLNAAQPSTPVRQLQDPAQSNSNQSSSIPSRSILLNPTQPKAAWIESQIQSSPPFDDGNPVDLPNLVINPAVETAETPAAQSIAPPGQEAAPEVTDLFQSYRSGSEHRGGSELGAVQLNTTDEQTTGQQTTGQHLGDPNATLLNAAQPYTPVRQLQDPAQSNLNQSSSIPSRSILLNPTQPKTKQNPFVAFQTDDDGVNQPVNHPVHAPINTPVHNSRDPMGEGLTHGVGAAEPRQAAFQPQPITQHVPPQLPQPVPMQMIPVAVNAIQLNLPSAMAMVGGKHPAVAFAQWRVQEAYATVARAEALWLPSIQAGISLHRHDGNYQASDGTIVDVNRNSLQAGLGTGATGAGTTPRPGLVAQFHLADAIFQPKVARQTAAANEQAAKAVVNTQMLRVATGYVQLVDAYQEARIVQESNQRTAQLARITRDFAEVGEGLRADANRMQTELSLTQSRLIGSQERIAVASARLSQALSIRSGDQIVPMDVNAIPLILVANVSDKASLISTALATRPELRESQALVAQACQAQKREQYAPFVPSVLLGYSTGGFGGGLGNNLDDVSGRYDFDASLTWQIRNLGRGDQAARRQTAARVQQAKYEKIRLMDQVALEVSQAFSQVQFRSQQMAVTQQAIAAAQQSYQSNLERIQEGEGLPIEVLQSIQALETARRAYLRSVIDHNMAQFQLQWALGWPVGS